MNEQVFQWPEEINAVSEVFNVYPWEHCLVIKILRRLTESFTVFDFPPFLCAGYNCQVNIDECASNPCLNQGTCLDDVSGYTCHCVLPYTGESWGPAARRDARSYHSKPRSLRDGVCGGQWCCPEESLPDHLSCPHCLGRPLWENTVVGILVCLYFLGFEKNCLIIHVLNWYIADGLVIIWMDYMAFALGLSFANTTATTYRSFTICQTLYIFWSICSSAHGNSIE